MDKKQEKKDRKLQNKILWRYTMDVEYYAFFKVVLCYIIFSTMMCIGYLAHTYFVRKIGFKLLKSILMDCGFVWFVSTVVFIVIAVIIQEIGLRIWRGNKEKEEKIYRDFVFEQLNDLYDAKKISKSDKFRYHLREVLDKHDLALEDLEFLCEQDKKSKRKKKK